VGNVIGHVMSHSKMTGGGNIMTVSGECQESFTPFGMVAVSEPADHASELAALEHRVPSGQLYYASSVRPTLAGQAVTPDHAP
jgi:hypothetical protein